MNLTADILLYFNRHLSYRISHRTAEMDSVGGLKYLAADIKEYQPHMVYVCDDDTFLSHKNDFPSNAVIMVVFGNEDIAGSYDDISFGMISVYTSSSAFSVLNDLLDSYYRFLEWDKKLHISALEGKSIQDLFDISEAIMGYPMIAFDASFNVLAHTKCMPANDSAFRETLDKGYTNPEIMGLLKQQQVFTKIRQDDLLVAPAAGSENLNIYMQFFHHQTLLGYNAVFLNQEYPEKGYIDLVRFFMETMSLCMQRDYETKRHGKMMYETFLQHLMEDHGMDHDQIREQADNIDDIAFEGNYLLACLSFEKQEGVPLVFLARMLENQFAFVKPFIYDGRIYLIKQTDEAIPPEEFLSALESARLDELLAKYRYSIGISNPFHTIALLRDAGIQTRAALVFGQKMHLADNVYRYKDYYRYHLIALLAQKTAPESLQSEGYKKLHAHDLINNTSYESFILTYLKNDCSMSKTADETNVHRNTVRNNISWIRNQFGLDLSDVNTKRDFVFSSEIGQYLKIFQEEDKTGLS